jgi:NAD(P)-dependent dehydrogenase (short-subunit alcohol dehydrogenase family)
VAFDPRPGWSKSIARRPVVERGGPPETGEPLIDLLDTKVLLLCQAVAPRMIARDSGRIINVARLSGTRAFPPIIATSVAKTAVIRFGEGLAAQLAGHGVRVFAIQPGVVRTRLLESYGLELPEDGSSGPSAQGRCARGLPAADTTPCPDDS